MYSVISCLFILLCGSDAARILAFYPTASISHQVVFRPLTLELAKRGHDVVVITTDPIFPKGGGPPNLKEIDVHDLSYTLWRNELTKLTQQDNQSIFDFVLKLMLVLVEKQVNTPEVQQLMNDKTQKFDLVIVEAYVEAALGIAHHFKAPVIQFSSLSAGGSQMNVYGVPMHPLVYPSPIQEKLYNLTMLEKLNGLYVEYNNDQVLYKNFKNTDKFLKKVFGPDVPSFEELRANVDMLFLNVHACWDFNRPVPPNVKYLGGLHQKEQKDLPKIQTLVNVFSKLPYDVLWKWNHDELPGKTENIKISKWLPQSDLLRHPKVKLFVTQGGLQSTDEAITAGVPLVGMPVFGDQRFNVEQYLYFKIGERVELETVSEEKLSAAINKILKDDSYRADVARLRTIMNDQPETPLQRAVWWTEYVIRHKGAKHLRSPAANMSIAQYYELELVSYVILGLLFALSIFVSLVYIVYCKVFKRSAKDKKVKTK